AEWYPELDKMKFLLLYTNKQEVMLRILEIDENIDKCIASDVEKQERLVLLKECDDLTNLEDMDMVQKSRIKWDVEGDENSKFFHGMLKQKRNQQMVKGIMIDGEWVMDPHRVKLAFFNFYKEKFEARDAKVNLITVTLQVHLDLQERYALEDNVSNEEIKAAVWDCGSQKAPGPDGFTFLFIKSYWELFKPDVEAAVRYFFDHFAMPKGANSSFITLIPKVANPIHIKDFCPISLIGVHYKIIAKILANRLVKVVDKVVSPEQSTFISVDFEKAYDTVSWKFLDHMLSALGFGSKWRRWINLCLQTSRSSVLVNGSPSSEFPFSRGLRQGDPLSPFLFIIIMEGINIVLEDAVASGLIHGTKVGDTNLNISHLFYADDVVIVFEWNKQDMENIIRVMQIFNLASGLKINISKSNVYGIGVSSE
ncbi:putative RNA-directed DNA polymerase, eukaryota, reverse transcriptase zinc-binding domain protein, partial [Tanacetum coccineum]